MSPISPQPMAASTEPAIIMFRPPLRSMKRPAHVEISPLSKRAAEKAPKISAFDHPVVASMSCERAPSA